MACTLTTILAGVGGLYLLAKVVSYARALLSLFVLSGTSLRKFGRKGSWAIVTGASDGIGKEYAIQLAQKGFNIVLISRTQSKLEALAQEIQTKYAGSAIQTKILTMDFTKNLDEDYSKLKALVDGLDVAVLVNNVGKSHEMPVPFILTPKQELNDIIAVNCIGTLRVTQIVAPGMAQRGRGLILTMGSFGGLLPTPLLATYSGSKAFLQQWSTALGAELKPHGVQVELVISYLVTSAMSKIRRPSLAIPNPRNFVKTTLAKIGRSGGAQGIAYTSTPYWSHGLMHWALSTFVGTMNHVALGQNKAMHESIRKRALKKQEREAKKAL
ncbi:estradiol 17-beta-dehydrogenase-like protein 12-b [Xylona heveae TC161]|uniref:Very-long-chain 3-oxoacyl-CoA reductase n=1 Tax=Xylona heveae (strain CBS 132557 / TC161) TaxID=1328760 RepID=A0A161TGR2_XYLHT|nr:estradiol 17-beta-dehydrogenase-like protein 12-b [Xylona heveae TC161]KZF25377.1 estradiol 17-beta-dehydrogenase-like protein 12-b [Xylona heveae TC161]